MKPSLTYKFRKGANQLKSHALPRLRHISDKFIVKKAEIREAGVYPDGTEYQVIYIEIKEGVIE